MSIISEKWGKEAQEGIGSPRSMQKEIEDGWAEDERGVQFIRTFG
jgi:hypothetical protein